MNYTFQISSISMVIQWHWHTCHFYLSSSNSVSIWPVWFYQTLHPRHPRWISKILRCCVSTGRTGGREKWIKGYVFPILYFKLIIIWYTVQSKVHFIYHSKTENLYRSSFQTFSGIFFYVVYFSEVTLYW